jgi:hypothetical protein
MTPDTDTDIDADAALAAELLRFERALAARDPADVPGGLPSLIAEDFEEFGASGRRWDRASTVAALADVATPRAVDLRAFAMHRLAEDVVLVTYEIAAAQAGGTAPRSLRSSIWVSRGGRWQVRFHQGTPIGEATG